MSVIVKGMKMPEICLDCPMQFAGFCNVSPDWVKGRVAPTVDEAWEQKKPEWCPLEEQKTGRWIANPFPDDWVGTLYKCSECGSVEDSRTAYCPRCGAKMEEKENANSD